MTHVRNICSGCVVAMGLSFAPALAQEADFTRRDLEAFQHLLGDTKSKASILPDSAFSGVKKKTVAVPGTNIVATTADVTTLLKIETKASRKDYGKFYGRIVLTLSEPKIEGTRRRDEEEREQIRQNPWRYVVDNVIKASFGTSSGNYIATISANQPFALNKEIMSKTAIASGAWEKKNILWITVSDKFSSKKVEEVTILQGLLIDAFTNTVRTTVDVTTGNFFSMDTGAAQTFLDFSKQIKLINALDPVIDGPLKTALSLADIILKRSDEKNIATVKDLHFLGDDGHEGTGTINIEGVNDGVKFKIEGVISLKLDASLFSNFDGGKFSGPFNEQFMDRQSTHLITGKTGWQTIAESSDAKLKKWAAEVEAAKIPGKDSADCRDIYRKLLDLYTLHDAQAIHWLALKKQHRVIEQALSDMKKPEERDALNAALRAYTDACLGQGPDSMRARLIALGLPVP